MSDIEVLRDQYINCGTWLTRSFEKKPQRVHLKNIDQKMISGIGFFNNFESKRST